MKRLIATLALFALALNLPAADAGWLTDLDAAKKKAAAEKRHVLIDFTGSDWCPPCKSLHKTVFMSEEFKRWAKAKKVVLVELDFPRRKPQPEAVKAANRNHSKAFAIRGFPTVVLLDPAGKETFRKVGFGRMSAKDYLAALETGLK
jgi:protein disulfide-isomerase